MRKGDIVRRINSAGDFIGRYYIVRKVIGNRVYVDDLERFPIMNSKDWHISFCKFFAKVVQAACIQISEVQFEAITSGYIKEISHPCTIRWDMIVNEQPEIVVFKCTNKDKYAWGIYESSYHFVRKEILNQNRFGEMVKSTYMVKVKFKHIISK